MTSVALLGGSPAGGWGRFDPFAFLAHLRKYPPSVVCVAAANLRPSAGSMGTFDGVWIAVTSPLISTDLGLSEQPRPKTVAEFVKQGLDLKQAMAAAHGQPPETTLVEIDPIDGMATWRVHHPRQGLESVWIRALRSGLLIQATSRDLLNEALHPKEPKTRSAAAVAGAHVKSRGTHHEGAWLVVVRDVKNEDHGIMGVEPDQWSLSNVVEKELRSPQGDLDYVIMSSNESSAGHAWDCELRVRCDTREVSESLIEGFARRHSLGSPSLVDFGEGIAKFTAIGSESSIVFFATTLFGFCAFI